MGKHWETRFGYSWGFLERLALLRGVAAEGVCFPDLFGTQCFLPRVPLLLLNFLSMSTTDPSMLIQGKVPGVSITNTAAGDPNNAASIQIRGVSSRSAGLGPLIVIDGVPGGNQIGRASCRERV